MAGSWSGGSEIPKFILVLSTQDFHQEISQKLKEACNTNDDVTAS